MRILITPDKFKGSLSALEVCQAIGGGLQRYDPSITSTYHPMADGGDGSLAAIANHLPLIARDVHTTDPLGRGITARYYTSSDAAFIEVASASGLVLLSPSERNPLKTSTFGTGKMILDAIDRGIEHIYLFLGGSATNDAGMGIAAALGCQFLDEHKKELEPTGENLHQVKFLVPGQLIADHDIKLTLLCDVTSHLYGPGGAAQVYARQKGASDEQIEYLDRGLRHFNALLQDQSGVNIHMIPGSGAAGGIAASLIALFDAQIEKGFASIARLTGLEAQITSADVVVSGEGKLDIQSLQGKVVHGVAELCQKHNKPLVLFVGKNDLSRQEAHKLGARHIHAIAEEAKDMEDAISNAATYLSNMAFQYGDQLRIRKS
jgi:glycerate kinase